MASSSNSRTNAGQGHGATYFARKHRISRHQAREHIRKYGNDRDRLNQAAIELKASTDG